MGRQLLLDLGISSDTPEVLQGINQIKSLTAAINNEFLGALRIYSRFVPYMGTRVLQLLYYSRKDRVLSRSRFDSIRLRKIGLRGENARNAMKKLKALEAAHTLYKEQLTRYVVDVRNYIFGLEDTIFRIQRFQGLPRRHTLNEKIKVLIKKTNSRLYFVKEPYQPHQAIVICKEFMDEFHRAVSADTWDFLFENNYRSEGDERERIRNRRKTGFAFDEINKNKTKPDAFKWRWVFWESKSQQFYRKSKMQPDRHHPERVYPVPYRHLRAIDLRRAYYTPRNNPEFFVYCARIGSLIKHTDQLLDCLNRDKIK